MRVGIVTDIHLGPERVYYGPKPELQGEVLVFSSHANKLLQEVMDVFQKEGVEQVINLGDLVQEGTDNDQEENEKNILSGCKLLKNIDVPVRHVIGNHETIALPLERIPNVLDLETSYYSFDSENWHFVVLFSFDQKTSEDTSEDEIIVSEEQLSWLENDLDTNKKPALVFIHHSLADQDVRGNLFFDGREERCLVKNRRAVRDILERAGSVKAVFNGHLHWNDITSHDGIPHFTLQSLTQRADNNAPAKGYAIVECSEEELLVRIFGNKPKEYRIGV